MARCASTPPASRSPHTARPRIVEYARALTGWTYARTDGMDDYRIPVVPNITTSTTPAQPRHHDIGSKTLLGGVVLPASPNTTAALYADVDGVVNSIMAHPNLAPFVSMRLIRSLVTSNPSPNYVQRVATVFRDTGGDLRATLTAILTDPESRSFTTTDGRLKDPILHILGLTRALGVPVANPGDVQWNFYSLLQLVLTPNTVFNFYNLLTPLPSNTEMLGPEFGIYPPALAVQRANFIYGLLWDWYSGSFPMSGVLPAYQSVASDPAALAEAVNQNLMFGRMTSDLRGLIVAATAAITDTSAGGLRERARGALYLAAMSSEFSVYSDASVASASSVQPPTGLTVSGLDGTTVTLTWRAPLIGPAPTSYVLEGGVRPGEVLATIPIAGTVPTFTFQAPPGAFYIRLRTVSGAGTAGLRRDPAVRRRLLGPDGAAVAHRLRQRLVGGAELAQHLWRRRAGGHRRGCHAERRPRGQHPDAAHQHLELRRRAGRNLRVHRARDQRIGHQRIVEQRHLDLPASAAAPRPARQGRSRSRRTAARCRPTGWRRPRGRRRRAIWWRRAGATRTTRRPRSERSR